MLSAKGQVAWKTVETQAEVVYTEQLGVPAIQVNRDMRIQRAGIWRGEALDVLAAARAAARKIHDVQERARALARVGSTKDSLEAAITISGPKTRGEALADIICRVPSVERDNALEVLCKGTEDFTEPDNRVAAKEAAIGRLTERGVIDAAFKVFLTVSDSAARRSCSKILLRRLDAQVAVETIQHMRGWLAILGRGKRSDLMAELREFVPLFHNLDDSLPERVARAALDVCQWWP